MADVAHKPDIIIDDESPVTHIGEYRVGQAMKYLNYLEDQERELLSSILIRRLAHHNERLVEYHETTGFVVNLGLVDQIEHWQYQPREVAQVSGMSFPVVGFTEIRNEFYEWLAGFPWKAALVAVLTPIAHFLGWHLYPVQAMVGFVFVGAFLTALPGEHSGRFSRLVKRGQLAIGPFVVLSMFSTLDIALENMLSGIPLLTTGSAIYYCATYGVGILQAVESWGVPIPAKLKNHLRNISRGWDDK